MRMISPDMNQLKKYAQLGYRCAPVSLQILADIRTPIEVLRILRNISGHCFLLESAAEHDSWGRYTFLGYDPGLEITCKDGQMRIRCDYPHVPPRMEQMAHDWQGSRCCINLDTRDPGKYISQILEDYKSPVMPELPPFTGGLVGYFAYDYIKYAEPSLRLNARDTEQFQDVDLMLFDKVIAFDNYAQKIFLIVNVQLDACEEQYAKAQRELEMMARLLQEGRRSAHEPGKLLGPVQALFDKEAFCSMVERAKHHIYEGDIFQIVLSNRLEAPFEGSLLDTYRLLRTVNPSPYMFYFSSASMEAAGASPETLVKLEYQPSGPDGEKEGILHTFPLAGTRARGKTRQEDLQNEKELLADPKELAEHSMLVDLGRNDLGKISRFGTVEVEEAYSVHRYSHVMHIGSTVRGTIRPDKGAVDAVNAVLPAGTLSGAPKIMACQLINDLEKDRRGIYGGAVGYISFTGNLDTCIAIRLTWKKNGKVFVRSGAGIVADSEPEKEYQECINKAAAVMKALENADAWMGGANDYSNR